MLTTLLIWIVDVFQPFGTFIDQIPA